MTAKNLMTTMVSNNHLDAALEWLNSRRKHCLDRISLSQNFPAFKQDLRRTLLAGEYQFSPLEIIPISTGYIGRWGSQDALVIKALTRMLQRLLAKRWKKNCFHVSGQGGLKAALREVKSKLPEYTYCFKTDIESFYRTMDHHYLLSRFAHFVKDKRVMRLIDQCLNRVEVYQARDSRGV